MEHPPVMAKQLVHGLFNGRRWDLTKRKAAVIAVNAVKDGLVRAPYKDRVALGIKDDEVKRSTGRGRRVRKGAPISAAPMGNNSSPMMENASSNTGFAAAAQFVSPSTDHQRMAPPNVAAAATEGQRAAADAKQQWEREINAQTVAAGRQVPAPDDSKQEAMSLPKQEPTKSPTKKSASSKKPSKNRKAEAPKAPAPSEEIDVLDMMDLMMGDAPAATTSSSVDQHQDPPADVADPPSHGDDHGAPSHHSVDASASDRADARPERPSSSSASKKQRTKDVAIFNGIQKRSQTDDALVASLAQPGPRLVQFDVLDCTFGAGHHTCACLEYGEPYSRVVALDCDYAVARAVEQVKQDYTPRRFKFFANKMSESHTMFGSRAFDAVVIDPGASISQLTDPRRGFVLDDGNDSAFDMRYGPHLSSNSSALSFFNHCAYEEIEDACRYYTGFNRRMQKKVARVMSERRPYRGSRELAAVLQQATDSEIPDEAWFLTVSQKFNRLPPAVKMLYAVRCAVNHEYSELTAGLRNAMMMLRPEGRVVVFARMPWEIELVQSFVDDHPYALLVYRDSIPPEECSEFSQPLETTMFVITRSATSSFRVKNMALSEEDVAESAMRRMYGLTGDVAGGFPANQFTVAEFLSGEERGDARANRAGVAPDVSRSGRVHLK